MLSAIPPVHRSEIQHVVRCIGKNLGIFGGASRRQLLLIAADRVDDAAPSLRSR